MATRTDLAVEARLELDQDPQAKIEGLTMKQHRTREGILLTEVRPVPRKSDGPAVAILHWRQPSCGKMI